MSSLPNQISNHDENQDNENILDHQAGSSLRQELLAGQQNAYLNGLNKEQREAVETIEGPLLVLAGAGTGKTRVLTTRIGHILSLKLANPKQILAVTFTNKAAREMRERIGQIIGPSVEGMTWLGTFHSIGVKILRRHAELVGLKNNFTILDTDDQIRLLKQLIVSRQIDEKRWPARQLAHLIDQWKNRGMGPEKLSKGDGSYFADGLGAELYREYQERLRSLNAVDFGDLLLLCIQIFTNNSDILQQYQKQFSYILVDEYQDTNVAQYLWLRLLAQANKNICVVGDDDQAIYGWRGAEVDNILKFEKDFPGAKVIRLERNYRSTSNILKAASGLIAHNQSRLGKTLHTDTAEEGDKIMLLSCWDSSEEARLISDEIEGLQAKKHQLNEIAVMVRASSQMREFEERFIALGINYRVIGGPRFYERREIRDSLAYFRLILHSGDDLAFERIINVPRRGIGDKTLKMIRDFARHSALSLYDAALELIETEDIAANTRKSLQNFIQNIQRWSRDLKLMPHTELAEIILDESGYTDMWKAAKTADAPGRLENLKELIHSMEEFESLSGFMEHISLVMDRDAPDAHDAVNLMTLHSAKGLEYLSVFLPGWEDGLFPHQRALDETGLSGLEEERRLAYVGLTRARERLWVSLAQNRRTHGLWQPAIPSRFLDELPRETVEIMDGGAARSFGSNSFSSVSKGFGQNPEVPSNMRTIDGTARHIKPNRHEETGHDYTIGERVFHQKFGYGSIINIEGNKLSIEFEKAGQKRVLASFVQRS